MAKEKCFISYDENSLWAEDLFLACKDVLCNHPYDFEINNYENSSLSDITKREGVLDLIKHAPYGVYDISYQQDRNGNWHAPSNIYIELGIAILFNQNFLCVRNLKDKKYPLPETLHGLDKPIVEFAGSKTLRDELQKEFHKMYPSAKNEIPYQQCNFINKSSKFRDIHPRLLYYGQPEINAVIIDGEDSKEDFRHFVAQNLKLQQRIRYSYFENAYQLYKDDIKFCNFCQSIRSSYIHIFRITDNTTAEVYIALGMSLALERELPYSIPRLIFFDSDNSTPSILVGYNNVIYRQSDKKKRVTLSNFIAEAIKTITSKNLIPDSFEYIDNGKASYLEEKNLIESVANSLSRYKENYKERYFDMGENIKLQELSSHLTSFLEGSLNSMESKKVIVSVIKNDYPLTLDLLSENEHCVLKVIFTWRERGALSISLKPDECALIFKRTSGKLDLGETHDKGLAIEMLVKETEREEGGGEEEEEEE